MALGDLCTRALQNLIRMIDRMTESKRKEQSEWIGFNFSSLIKFSNWAHRSLSYLPQMMAGLQ